jgi:hypothetical protein
VRLLLKQHRIDEIYKILVFFEKIGDDKSKITEESYIRYLDRLYVIYRGYGDPRFYEPIKGLRDIGINITHEVVKSVVFDMIHILNKEY